ncbi:MAG TPA: hypothetical protein VH914_15530 [Acidimicrobiia bacterium]|nr:hypothetical protein [Acidimicrobiia bacterium]
MIFEVRAFQALPSGSGTVVTRPVFAFGTNVNATTADTPDTTGLAIAATHEKFRLIMSDLLLGNFLDDVSCRDGSFQFVPVAATPDDIAKCAVAQDVLPLTCTGANAVCICQNPAGCEAGQIAGSAIAVQQGEPVGVLDTNEDGAADQQQFHEGSVEIICTGKSGTVYNVPIDLANSYWTPSGDQQEPAEGSPTPFDLMGPAIVLVPRQFDAGAASVPSIMPTNSVCNFKFSPTVIDKKGERPCAPVGGFGGSGVAAANLSCTPGDTTAANMTTEPLVFSATHGVNSLAFDGTPVQRLDVISVLAADTIPLSPTSISNTQVLEGSNVYNQVVVALTAPYEFSITPTNGSGFDPDTDYTLVFPTTITDSFGEPAAQTLTIPFHTAP